MPEEDQRMPSMWTAVATLAGAATLEVSAASPRIAERCGVERNTYYKQADDCFRRLQVIQYFRNGGCYIHERRGSGLRLTSAAASTSCSGWSGCWDARAEQPC
jgi:hypothetical protein